LPSVRLHRAAPRSQQCAVDRCRDRRVAAAADEDAILDDDSADRHFATRLRCLREGKRLAHPLLVAFTARRRQRRQDVEIRRNAKPHCGSAAAPARRSHCALRSALRWASAARIARASAARSTTASASSAACHA
jgi:hypothetical protein